MRAVALSQDKIQQTISKHYIPLKIEMTYPPKMKSFPLDWPAMVKWRIGYKLTSGKGYTGCSVVSPDLKTEYASTGSALVWELFDSTAYDEKKFQSMLDQGLKFALEEKKIRQSTNLPRLKKLQLAKFRAKVARENRTQVRLPPKGFTAERAKELFQLTGDLPTDEVVKK